MDSNAVIAISVVFSLIGLLLLIFLLLNTLCLWQAKPLHREDTNDSESNGCCKSSKYQVRAYLGCLPRCKGPRKHWTKMYEYSIRRCWFKMCCGCCQELRENQSFIDEVFIPPAVIIAPASPKSGKRPESLPIRTSYGSTSSTGIDATNDRSPRGGSVPKISILAPDPIVVSMDRYTPTQSTIQEETDTVDFYAYQLEGKAGDRMLY